jgi:hypothetical protein
MKPFVVGSETSSTKIKLEEIRADQKSNLLHGNAFLFGFRMRPFCVEKEG